MHFTSIITVEQSIDQVWDFLSNPANASKWDRSVDHVILPETGFTGLGCTVFTVSPSGMQQAFEVTAFQPPCFFKFRLVESSMFKQAELSFKLEKNTTHGSKITHEIHLKLRYRSFFLYPLLLLTHKKALGTDMKYLQQALNANYQNDADK